MTERLRHSLAGYRRLIQITQAAFFVLVEGKLDRVFYDGVCSVALQRHGVLYDIRMVGELPVSTGGKPGVLEFYDHIRKRKELVSEFKGKKTVVVFFLDKDVDDVTRCMRRSPHVIYTRLFEVENYVFRFGDVIRSVAAVLRVPRQNVEPLIPRHWHVVAAETWRDWTTLCLLVQLLGISAEANYRVQSRINTPCAAPTNNVELNHRVLDIRNRSGLPSGQFDHVLGRATAIVKRRYDRGEHDSVFRGKWYPQFVRHWTSAIGGSLGDDELMSVLITTLAFDDAWSVPLVQKVEDLARSHGLLAG